MLAIVAYTWVYILLCNINIIFNTSYKITKLNILNGNLYNECEENIEVWLSLWSEC